MSKHVGSHCFQIEFIKKLSSYLVNNVLEVHFAHSF